MVDAAEHHADNRDRVFPDRVVGREEQTRARLIECSRLDPVDAVDSEQLVAVVDRADEGDVDRDGTDDLGDHGVVEGELAEVDEVGGRAHVERGHPGGFDDRGLVEPLRGEPLPGGVDKGGGRAEGPGGEGLRVVVGRGHEHHLEGLPLGQLEAGAHGLHLSPHRPVGVVQGDIRRSEGDRGALLVTLERMRVEDHERRDDLADARDRQRCRSSPGGEHPVEADGADRTRPVVGEDGGRDGERGERSLRHTREGTVEGAQKGERHVRPHRERRGDHGHGQPPQAESSWAGAGHAPMLGESPPVGMEG